MDVTFLILSPIITFTTSSVVFRMVLRASEETRFLFFNPPNTFEPISLWRDFAWITVLALLSGKTCPFHLGRIVVRSTSLTKNSKILGSTNTLIWYLGI